MSEGEVLSAPSTPALPVRPQLRPASAPLVSVVIPTRNRPIALARALNSVASQSLREFEVIVVDDGSRGADFLENKKTLEQFDERFILVRSSLAEGYPAGPSTARNVGIKHARGEFVAFLDDDDFWISPDHLEIACRALRNYEADYFFSVIRCERAGPCPMPWEPPLEPLIACEKLSDNPPLYRVDRPTLARTLQRFMIHLDVTVVKRRLLEEVGGFANGLYHGCDLDLMIRLADSSTKTLFRSEPTASFQVPEANSVSTSGTPIERRFYYLIAAQQSRYSCRSSLFQKSARARNCWLLRELSVHFMQQKRKMEALRLAAQALVVYFTMGSAWFFLKQLGRALTSRYPDHNQHF